MATSATIPALMGWDPLQVDDANSTTSPRTAQFKPGFKVVDASGTTWMYVRYTGAFSTNAACAIQATTFTLATLTRTIGTNIVRVGVPQQALSAPSSGAYTTQAYTWVAIAGPMTVKVRGGVVTNARLYTNTTAGKLTSSLTSNIAVEGLKPTTTSPTATSLVACIAATELFTRGVAGNT